MREEKEIEAVIDRLYTLVDTGDHEASIIYDTLRWVQGLDDEDPYSRFIGEEEGDD